MASIKADYAAVTAGSVQMATDQASLTALQAKIAGDQTTATAADATLSTDLQPLKRPVFLDNPDGTGTAVILAYATTAPGYTVVVADPAS